MCGMARLGAALVCPLLDSIAVKNVAFALYRLCVCVLVQLLSLSEVFSQPETVMRDQSF